MDAWGCGVKGGVGVVGGGVMASEGGHFYSFHFCIFFIHLQEGEEMAWISLT